jgi:hypothetical protein
VLVVGLGALARGLRRLPRQRMQDSPPELGSILSAAVREDDDTELLLRDKGDVGRGIVQAAVLVDDREIAGGDDLPRQGLREVSSSRLALRKVAMSCGEE